MLHIWIDETLHYRISECLELRLRKIEGLEKFLIHNLADELAYFRILDALLDCIKS